MIKRRNSKALSFILCAVVCLCLFVSFFTVNSSAVQNRRDYRNMEVILGGVPFGVKFSTEGVVIVGFSDIDGLSKAQNPAYLAGLRPKDMITKINGKTVSGASELTKAVEECGGKTISLTYRRGGTEKTVKITPTYSNSESKYKTGVWVKDSGAGIGTVTYVVPDTLEFAGLGHGICDGETGELIPMRGGVVMDVTINSIKKGISGVPGELKGYFGTKRTGALYSNTDQGVYGRFISLPAGCSDTIKIGPRSELCEGEAYISCSLDTGKREEYKIEISAINRESNTSKCFVIKIKDDRLIAKTGGIVQGMSGSPIIQNGKLVGAVTHVMINDPTVGYGIFIDNMLATPIAD